MRQDCPRAAGCTALHYAQSMDTAEILMGNEAKAMNKDNVSVAC